jgi:hypothetical protein
MRASTTIAALAGGGRWRRAIDLMTGLRRSASNVAIATGTRNARAKYAV